jgi:hypothetical protein
MSQHITITGFGAEFSMRKFRGLSSSNPVSALPRDHKPPLKAGFQGHLRR